MDRLTHPLSRCASWLLIYLTAAQPLHPAIAAGITAANGNTQVVMAPGNIPVINIAPPNAAGISHNTYKDFNVDAPGAVLNNATQNGKSQLGVAVNGNTRLNGKPAELIINEVTSGNRSELKGKLEVFGNKAGVMIANPNGITCDGCGFINTPSVTLTTGKPQFDKQGALDALEVKKGAVIIGGKGLDGASTEYVDVISRASELNGKITARNISLMQGANRLSYKDGTLTTIVGDGAKPQLAVDTKALGGMYANKIRLVASEEGVGVNLANLTSTQQGITLSVKGKIQLGNTAANTDLNIFAKQTDIIKDATVKSGRDITITSTLLNNNGVLSAGKDMRLFNDNLTNTQATIQANDNLWIQKDAAGNKGIKVDNRSGMIKTVSGDLVIRTGLLDNVRDKIIVQEKEILPDTALINPYIGSGFELRPPLPGTETPFVYKGEFDSTISKKWFGNINLYETNQLHTSTRNVDFSILSPVSNISSSKHLYINSDEVNNISSVIHASGDIIMTGNNLKNQTSITSSKERYEVLKLERENIYSDFFTAANIEKLKKLKVYNSHIRRPVGFTLDKKIENFIVNDVLLGTINAGGNIIADFKGDITLNNSYKNIGDANKVSSLEKIGSSVSAKGITLHAGNINSEHSLNASNDITIIAEKNINMVGGQLAAGGIISAMAGDSIDIKQSNLTGRNVDLQTRTGDINIYSDILTNYVNANGIRQLSQINVSDSLSIYAAKNLGLSSVLFKDNINTILTAGQNLSIKSDDIFLLLERPTFEKYNSEKQVYFNDKLKQLSSMNASNDITLNAGKVIDISGMNINAKGNISVTSGEDINLNPKLLATIPESLFPESRQAELSTRLGAGKNLLISSGKDLLAQSADIAALGNTTLLAGNNLNLLATAYSAIDNGNDNNKDDRYVTARVHAGKKLALAANGDFITYGTDFTSGSDMTLSSGGKMVLNAVSNHIYREGGNEYSETVTQKNTTLNSGGVMTLLSNGSILFQATQLIAKGALDVAAKGGFLYAQAMEESSRYEKTTTKRKWYGKKTTIRQTSHNVTNKVTEFIAGGDINLLSRDDSTYEASKINAGKNARLTSTNGKVNFKAVKNTAFEQTITTSKGFFIKNADKGYTKDTWLLPIIYVGGQLTVDTAAGVNTDIKAKNAQALQNILLTLGDTPGTAWLKDLSTRKDVQWSKVQDAYSSWNHTTKSLNPVVGAVIAIAVAAATAGSGLAAYGANLAAGTVGSTSAAVTAATYGAAFSGITAITSQAAVALIDNQGNITKTLEALSSSHSVKSIISSMVVSGALSGFDSVMGFDKALGGTASNAKLPLLSNGDWSKIAQRVAGQSIISSSLSTTINGGNFKDNFTTALLANVGNQFQAEGAYLIGDNGTVLTDSGKILSHAVVASIAAEIGGGNGKGAAVGALAAELAAIIMYPTLFKPKYDADITTQISDTLNAMQQRETNEQFARFIGSLAGAFATNNASGVYSAADAAELIYRYNFDEHLLEPMADAINAEFQAALNGDKAAQKRIDDKMEVVYLMIDMMPVVGTVHSFANAETRLDYALAAISVIPGAGAALKNAAKIAQKLRSEGKVSEAILTINKFESEIALLRRPTWRQSEVDVGKALGREWRDQVSYKNGSIVSHGTNGSVRPDFVLGNMVSVEVKNYNITSNLPNLIRVVSEQAISRAANLPEGMVQQVYIDVRGQILTQDIREKIIDGIFSKSNGIIKPTHIRFMEK